LLPPRAGADPAEAVFPAGEAAEAEAAAGEAVETGYGIVNIVKTYQEFYSMIDKPFFAPPVGKVIRWRTEVWPLQWRLALGGVFSYFAYFLFSPQGRGAGQGKSNGRKPSPSSVRKVAFGFPRQFHELLATRVSISYKDNQPKPIPLTRHEKGYEVRLQAQLDALSTNDESAEVIADLQIDPRDDNGYNL